ncbi:MAG: hypothetical protein HOV80_03470 [Polyangiaceae bacterium]|nr:hypothetical protein [Polyangiaceae bacterium]
MSDDKDAILSRRAKLLATAFAGLAIPVAAVACSDPKPCLSIAMVPTSAPAEPTGTAAPTTTDAASAAPTAATPGPTQEGGIAVSADEAQKLGLPRLGFKASMKRGGWSITGPNKVRYAQASGPPGGPLIFRADPYDDGKLDQIALETLFKKALADFSGLDPIEKGPAETVTLGGRKLDAQAFRTGKSLATTNWCAVKAPAGEGARQGILFLFAVGTGEGKKPTCKASLDHDPIAEIVSTLKFEE